MKARFLLSISAALAILGFGAMGLGLTGAVAGGAIVWLCSGGAVIGFADAALVLCLLSSLVRFEVLSVYRCLVLGNLVAVVLYYPFTLVPADVCFPVSVCFFLLSLLITYHVRHGVSVFSGPFGVATLGASAPQLWRPVFGVSVLAFMAGLMLQISRQDEVALESFQRSSVLLSVIMYSLLFGAVFLLPRRSNLIKVYQIAIPISAVGFLLLPLIQNSAGGIVNSFSNLGYMLALLVLTCLVVEMARETSVSSGMMLSLAYASAYLAELLGMILGFCNASFFGRSALTVTAVALMAVYLLSIVSLALFKERNFRSAGVDSEFTACPMDYARACRSLSIGAGLTPRESEVLAQLGQGHTVRAIAERLIVSESTIKYHARIIYKKLGVHTRQELIDLLFGQNMQELSNHRRA